MNNSEQAKNGFKTFILTLSVSLALFGFIYYLATYLTKQDISIESMVALQEDSPQAVAIEEEDKSSEDAVLGAAVENTEPTAEEEPVVETASVFSSLVDSNSAPAVLAGASESTQSTVPSTGNIGMTYGIVSSLTLALVGLYMLAVMPRKRALQAFEKKISNRL